MSGSASTLPHLETIQRLFGSRHELSGIRSYIGGSAAAAATEIGAQAYAKGNQVAFAGPPTLHTAAHEAAHVVQQRAGVHLNSGVGKVGDAYEQNANAVADRVVQGLPAHDLLPGGGRGGSSAVIQRQPNQSSAAQAPTASQPQPNMSQAQEQILQSPDPDVNNKPVSIVGGDLRGRTKRYHDGIPNLKKSASQTKASEVDWYNKLGLIGEFIDLFNRAPQTDPNRWNALPAQWDTVSAGLEAVLQIPIDPEHINVAGTTANKALDKFDVVFKLQMQNNEEFSKYLQGFAHAAENVHTVAVVVRDISFAAAVGIAIVVAAPVVFTAVGTGVASMGVTGTAATALTYGGTALSMGALGASMEGSGQAVGTLLGQGTLFLEDLLVAGKTGSQAVSRFDWGQIGAEGWQGMKRGFVDGVLGYVAMGFDKVLAKGTSVALTRVLGQEGASTLTKILRMALTRAISGGATGAAIGALDAGIKASIDGKSFGEVVTAMENGFKLGGLTGTVLGAGGSVFEARTKVRLTAEIAELSELLVKNPKEFARRYQTLVNGLTPEQRAAWQTEMQGRRFVDRQHYEPAAEAYQSGVSPVPPQHRYGAVEFKDWREAAAMLDAHAQSGAPLSQAEVEAAHKAAAGHLNAQAGQPRGPNQNVIGAGGVGVEGVFSTLSLEQLAILETNPHIKLAWRGVSDGALTAEQAAARYETAVIAYPDGAAVQGKLDVFFTWYNDAAKKMNPTELAAAAQRELVSIHPFLDGNGRVSRLVMDHALQSKGLPPALLHEPGLDYMVSEAAWSAEVRRGIVEAYQSTLRHVDLFNVVLRSGDLVRTSVVWSTILGLTNNREALTRWLYNDDAVCR
jgi:prophage maintenance system killer protein